VEGDTEMRKRLPIIENFAITLVLLASIMIFGSLVIGKFISIDIASKSFSLGLTLLFFISVYAALRKG
jgi:hypothetical protein